VQQRQELMAAFRDLRRAIGLEPPGQPDDHVQLGHILHTTGWYREAVRAYDAALGIAPNHAAAHRGRGESLMQLSDHAEALRSFEQYLRNGQADADVYWSCGRARAELGRHEEAVDDYSRALALRGDAAILTDRGWAYLHCAARDLALRDFAQAIQLQPHYALPYYGRGYARIEQGQYRDGIADAETALRLGLPTPTSRYNLACVFALAAEKAGADAGNPDHKALRQRCEDRALELLGQALDECPALWLECVQDPDLASIRASRGFRQLEGRYAKPPG
jgi:tetratricopeptide (TPR) repeat protein